MHGKNAIILVGLTVALIGLLGVFGYIPFISAASIVPDNTPVWLVQGYCPSGFACGTIAPQVQSAGTLSGTATESAITFTYGSGSSNAICNGVTGTGTWSQFSPVYWVYVNPPITPTEANAGGGTLISGGTNLQTAAGQIQVGINMWAVNGQTCSSNPTPLPVTLNTPVGSVSVTFGIISAGQIIQPVQATLNGAGSSQTISVSGCSASPSTFGSALTNINANPSCTISLTLPSGYGWLLIGGIVGSPISTITTCASGTCPTISLSYAQAASTTSSTTTSTTSTTTTTTSCTTNCPPPKPQPILAYIVTLTGVGITVIGITRKEAA